MRFLAGLLILGSVVGQTVAEAPRVVVEGTQLQDRRDAELRNLNGYFPFKPVDNIQQWKRRQSEIRRRILVSQGLWPLPTKTPLRTVVHGRVERDDYVVDRVFFESAPGHFVTGSLYRPRQTTDSRLPAILSPHGHWADGRFYDAGEALVKSQVDSGAETSLTSGRYPIQARAVQLARMGCLVFVYDMTGNADAVQIGHRPAKSSHLNSKQDWGFMSVQADLRLQNMMGLQTWNSIRAIDFLLELDQTDPDRIGVTGASGGGTQSMIIGAVDDRVSAAMPCVMVSTAMQGGCTCENAPLLRIDQGNIDIAAAIAPRPLGLTAADDWTIELETKGYPDLVKLYEMLGHSDRLTAAFHTQFKHNYNQVNRGVMYSFFNRHFRLGLSEPIVERDYVPLSKQEATVWTDAYPPPSGNQIGDAHEIRLLKMATQDSDRKIQQLVPRSLADLPAFRSIVGGAWETILGRRLDDVGTVTFAESRRLDADRYVQRVGLVEYAQQSEQIPVVILEPKGNTQGTVIWVTDSGKSGLYQSGVPTRSVSGLIAAGFRVLAADLYGQGEARNEDHPDDAQRMWYQRDGKQGWHRFSGYTYGYNHCLFAQRVHDVLSLIKYSKSNSTGDIRLVGLGKVAGPLVAAALSQSGEAVAKTVVHTAGFRFENIERHNDPMFVPGAVKYLDVDGLLSLCAPARLHLLGESPLQIAVQTYQAIDAGSNLTSASKSASDQAAAMVDLITGD